MATRKTTAKVKNPETVATLDPKADKKTPKVETLPSRQTRAKDGMVILKTGNHNKLEKGTYEVHGSRLELSGNVFIAAKDVNWLPVKNCVCKTKLTKPTEIRKLRDGCFATITHCTAKECGYGSRAFVRIYSKGTFLI